MYLQCSAVVLVAAAGGTAEGHTGEGRAGEDEDAGHTEEEPAVRPNTSVIIVLLFNHNRWVTDLTKEYCTVKNSWQGGC